MFAKLLKHEFKASAGLLSVLCLTSLGVGVSGGFIIRYMANTPAWKIDDALGTILSVLFAVMIFSLFAFALTGWLYLCIQYYQRKFTDQGYLTFTLPVPAWQIYLSSFLNFMLWSILLGVAIVGSFMVMFLIGFFTTDFWYEIQDFWSFLDEVDLMNLMEENVLYSILDFINGILLVLNSITIGSVLAKKHKVLCTIGIYYLVSILISMLSGWLSEMDYIYDFAYALRTYQTVSILISSAFALGGAVLSVQLMKKKLNLT